MNRRGILLGAETTSRILNQNELQEEQDRNDDATANISYSLATKGKKGTPSQNVFETNMVAGGLLYHVLFRNFTVFPLKTNRNRKVPNATTTRNNPSEKPHARKRCQWTVPTCSEEKRWIVRQIERAQCRCGWLSRRDSVGFVQLCIL